MHDEIFDRLDSLDRTSLGLLFETKAIEHLDYIKVKVCGRVVNIIGCDFPEDFRSITNFNEYNIGVAHKFYEYDLSDESLKKEDLSKLGYNLLILGHDHVPYNTVTEMTDFGKVSIIRPGSFMRGTSHSYNTKRRVFIDTLEIGEGIKVIRDVLPVKAPEEVFTAAVIDKVDTKELSKRLSERFSELVTKIYSDKRDKVSVYSILDETEMDMSVKQRIESYLEAAGIFRDKI